MFDMQSDARPHQSAKLRRHLLHAVADLLEASGDVRGPVERILPKNIRVPLIRFVEGETGITCDVSCCGEASVIKAELLKSVLDVDERAVHLVRLVRTPSVSLRCHHLGFGTTRQRQGCERASCALKGPITVHSHLWHTAPEPRIAVL